MTLLDKLGDKECWEKFYEYKLSLCGDKSFPAELRRFIDSELCQLDKIYLYDLTNYKKTLEQRNKLMKDIYFNPSLRDTLSVWDEKIEKKKKKVIKRRREFIDEISGIVTDIHSNIS